MIHPVQVMLEAAQNNFKDYFQRLNDEEQGINLKPGHVKQTTFWLLDDNQYIGTFALRHDITPILKQAGGHIAYQIIPSKRRKGYAAAGLRLCIDEAFKLGLDKVLITCKEENIASYKTMHKVMIEMGGNEIGISDFDGHKNRRAWIMTEKRHAGKIRPLALAIIKKGNKILATKGYDDKKDEYFYRLPGGGIEFGEKAEDTLKREFMEEMSLNINSLKRLNVIENLFEFNGKKGHEIVIVFEAVLSDEDIKKDKFALLELEFEGEFAEFIEITPDKKIYPSEALQLK